MKGVILAGGLGSRLSPLTRVANKHLLPVWDQPMIHYPIENLLKSGIKEIVIVSNDADGFYRVLSDNSYGCKLTFAWQKGEGGIADALKSARDFVGDDNCCVMLGDNIYQYSCATAVRSFQEFMQYSKCDNGALIVTKQANKLEDLTRFGCVVSPHGGKIEKLVEKPHSEECEGWAESGSDASIITGCYCYTPDVFEICDKLKPSHRGELEITDVNQQYLDRGCLEEIQIDGWWQDAGTFESLYQAATLVRQHGANNDEPE